MSYTLDKTRKSFHNVSLSEISPFKVLQKGHRARIIQIWKRGKKEVGLWMSIPKGSGVFDIFPMKST